jgi:hypothetical protein
MTHSLTSRLVVAGVAAIAFGSAWLFGPAPSESTAGAAEQPAYVGSQDCKKCHFKQWKSWKETGMAKTFAVLKPGERADAKKKAGLDPAKDYSTDAACIACHTTGHGLPGGHPAANREGVQCESCHGPGSLYSPYMKEKEKGGFVREEAVKLGLTMPDEKSCVSCHKGGPGGSPTLPADHKFDPAKLKDEKAIHVHAPKG